VRRNETGVGEADSPAVSGYYPALDGIRAFAVAAVVLFHAGVTGVSGGFLGVDTFFVLSGFLITSLLLTERLRTGRIGLTAFWMRRVRRLIPGLLVMLAATVMTGHYLLDGDELGLLRTDALAALGYVANWRMIFRGTGYVAATAIPSPLQHTWSLGIEEQFYLLWPVLVAGLLGWLAVRKARWILAICCAVGAIASAWLCAHLYQPDSISRAYYGTDTRAQALLVGAALAAVLAPATAGPTVRRRTGQRRTGRCRVGRSRRHGVALAHRDRRFAPAVRGRFERRGARHGPGARSYRRHSPLGARPVPRVAAAGLARTDLVRRVSLALAPVHFRHC